MFRSTEAKCGEELPATLRKSKSPHTVSASNASAEEKFPEEDNFR